MPARLAPQTCAASPRMPTAIRPRTGERGLALIQVIVAMALVATCGVASMRSLMEMNRNAAAMRTLNQARAVVQRNIDLALGVPFNRNSTPPILAMTAASSTSEDIVVGRSGAFAVVAGNLTRIVAAEPNSDNADIRRVTFRITYTYRSKPYTFAMSTMRAMD